MNPPDFLAGKAVFADLSAIPESPASPADIARTTPEPGCPELTRAKAGVEPRRGRRPRSRLTLAVSASAGDRIPGSDNRTPMSLLSYGSAKNPTNIQPPPVRLYHAHPCVLAIRRGRPTVLISSVSLACVGGQTQHAAALHNRRSCGHRERACVKPR